MRSLAILEDNTDLRLTIEDYFGLSGTFKITCSSGDHRKLLNSKADIDPDFILLDIHLQQTLGTDLLKDIRAMYPESHVIMMTGDKDKHLLEQSFKNGACSIIYKPFKLQELESVINHVSATGSFIEPDVLTRLLGIISTEPSKNTQFKQFDFTQQENDIVEMVMKGVEYKQIIERLNMPAHRLNSNMKRIFIKADVKNLADLRTVIHKSITPVKH